MANVSQRSSKTYLPFRGVKNDPTLYTALDATSREIRYVDLHPKSDDDPVVCSLGYATLDPEINPEGMDYPTYCWGSVDDVVPITLLTPTSSETGDVTFTDDFKVTRNLKEALIALRYDSGTRRMWIDAMSINQMDDREKTHQVGHMNLIYSMATRVIVWLGLEDSHSSYVFRYHEKFQKKLAASPLGSQQHLLPVSTLGEDWQLRSLTRSLSRSILREAESSTAMHPPADTDYWRTPRTSSPADIHDLFTIGVENLLDRPWFRRIWVYGEVFLAPPDADNNRLVTVVVGSSSMRWSDLVHLVRAAAMKPFVSPKKSFLHSMSASNIMWFQQSWDVRGDALSTATLATCIHRTQGFQASDPRDKIFALVHLAQDTKDCVTTDKRLMPDYEQTLLEIILKYVGIGIMLVSEVTVTPYPQEDTLIRLDFGLTGRVLLGDEHIVVCRKVACVKRFLGPAKSPVPNVPNECRNTFNATDGRTYAVNCFLTPKDEVVACHLTRRPFVITPLPFNDGVWLVRGPCLCYTMEGRSVSSGSCGLG